jgi:hypothetical protein
LLVHGLVARSADSDCLDRLGLAKPRSLSEWLYAALIRGALNLS